MVKSKYVLFRAEGQKTLETLSEIKNILEAFELSHFLSCSLCFYYKSERLSLQRDSLTNTSKCIIAQREYGSKSKRTERVHNKDFKKYILRKKLKQVNFTRTCSPKWKNLNFIGAPDQFSKISNFPKSPFQFLLDPVFSRKRRSLFFFFLAWKRLLLHTTSCFLPSATMQVSIFNASSTCFSLSPSMWIKIRFRNSRSQSKRSTKKWGREGRGVEKKSIHFWIIKTNL